MYFALSYEYVPDVIERRKPYREAHLAIARDHHQGGRLVMAGAFDPPEGALFVFRADSAAEVEAFARNDPYVRNGIVTAWKVRAWTVVVGG